MPSKRYKPTEVDPRCWLHVPSGTPWSTEGTIYTILHHFKSDLIKNMDHMRISGIEPTTFY